MILAFTENRKVVAAVSFVVATAIVFMVWWIFFKSIGSFEDLRKGMYSGSEYSALGKRLEEAGQWNDAEKAYLEAITLEPGREIGAYIALDKIYQKKLGGKEDNIERLYLRGISQNPQSRALLRGLAQYYERVRNYTRAYQWYSMVVQYYPEDQDSRSAMTRAREKLNTE